MGVKLKGDSTVIKALNKGDSTVIKALNNNMVLVKDNGIEKIILAKGIGFNKKPGDIISENIYR